MSNVVFMSFRSFVNCTIFTADKTAHGEAHPGPMENGHANAIFDIVETVGSEINDFE